MPIFSLNKVRKKKLKTFSQNVSFQCKKLNNLNILFLILLIKVCKVVLVSYMCYLVLGQAIAMKL